ncbi:MAG: DUF2917 domain-containing protein [Anaeromyxobacter sp.]
MSRSLAAVLPLRRARHAEEPPRRQPESFALAEWTVRAIDVRPRRPIVVTCRSGELLVTFEGDEVDHIVPAGEAFRMDRPGRLVVAALRPSRVEVSGG